MILRLPKSKIAAAFLTTAALTAASTALTAPAAHAASASACAASPSKANCDGVDPTAGGGVCLQNSWMIGSAYGYPVTPHYDQNYGGGPVAVKIQLWWSQTCQSNWARVVSTGYSGGYVVVDLWTNPDRRHQSYVHYLDASGYWSALYTNLLYAPSPYSAAACATDQQTWGGCGPYV